jgi:hypothetical protein
MAYIFTRAGAQIEEIHNTVDDPKSNAQFSDDIRTIAGEYRGLWPDTGGSANKGDTYQTQVGGTGTGQYFTALQNTTVSPVSDNVNWISIIGVGSIGSYTDITYSSVSDMVGGLPIPLKIGETCNTLGTFYKRNLSNGDVFDFDPITDVNLDAFSTLKEGIEFSFIKGSNSFSNKKNTVSEVINLAPTGNITAKIREIEWDGDYNLSNSDRLIGVINIAGSTGSTTTVTSSDLSEGVSTFTVSDSSLFVEGGYAQLLGGSTDYVCKVTNISGSDVTLDYSLGFDNTGENLSIRQITPIENVNINVGKFTDSSGSTDPENMVSGVSMINAANSSVSVGQAYNTIYPVIFTSNTYNCKAHRSYLNRTRDTSAGRGYLVQWNKAHKAHNYKLLGHGGRHLIDYTRAAHCTSLLCQSNDFQQYPYTLHGAYEHDISFTDCGNPSGKYAIALANAGVEFGQQSKRVTFSGGDWDGDMLCDVYPTDVTFENMNLLGQNSILANPTYRLGGNGSFNLINVKMKNELSSTLFRGTDAAGYPTSNVYISSGCVTGKYIEFNGIDGNVIAGGSDIGQPFTSGGLSIDLFESTGCINNQWGATSLDCKSFKINGGSTLGKVANARVTVNCEKFIKSGGEDIQSPSFGVSGAVEFNLSGFTSHSVRSGISLASYQLLLGFNGDAIINGVKLKNTGATPLDLTSTSANRVKLQLNASTIDGALDISSKTQITESIITSNRLSSSAALPSVDALHLENSNLKTL